LILHMIGNAHIDPVWLWRWTEGCAEAIGTCWAAVDRLEEHGGFIFTRGEAQIYQWVEDFDPKLFQKIREYVRAGRWSVVNGWWLQPDCNLPSGEAFLRQALYGKAYFKRAFGLTDIKTGYNVDSFGHAATLPMLLCHTGYENYVFMRPQEHEKALDFHLFNWCSPNGSEVRSYRIPFAYTTSHHGAGEAIERHLKLLEEAGHDLMCFYGVGNHGGGPTRENIKLIDEARSQGQPLEFSHPARYFEATKDLPQPTLQDELHYHAIGCYAVMSELKRLNRLAEENLAVAEAGAALANFAAHVPYPRERFQVLWKTVLFNQFHDTLGGTSLPSATQDALQALGGVVQEAQQLTNTAVRHLAAQVEAGPAHKGASFLVFNFTGFTQTLPVEYEPWLEWNQEPHTLFDHEGNEVSYQTLAPESQMKGPRRILFHANLPTYGYRFFRFLPNTSKAEKRERDTSRTKNVLETKRWRLEPDSATGGIAKLFDKRFNKDVLSALAQPLVVDDPSDTWSHGLDRFGTTGESFVCDHVEMVEHGSLRQRIRTVARYKTSVLTTDYLLYENEETPLELRVSLDWRERHKLLRLVYPFALENPTFRYEIPYGSLEREADGRESPGQRWVTASTSQYSVIVANDAKYSYAAQGSTLMITAVRSPVAAHHDPYVLDPEHRGYPYTDQGLHQFTLRLLAGSKLTPRIAYTVADGLTRAPLVTPHVGRGGTWPQQQSLLEVTGDSCAPMWLKAAEESDDLILRVLETNGKAGAITVLQQANEVSAFGVVSLKLSREKKVVLCDGLEH
jgi:alpha-mannosidase